MHGKHGAISLLIIGIILILTRLYTAWDIWIVIGAILAIKGLIHFVIPRCCEPMPETKGKKK